jgi:hypothetical protein
MERGVVDGADCQHGLVLALQVPLCGGDLFFRLKAEGGQSRRPPLRMGLLETLPFPLLVRDRQFLPKLRFLPLHPLYAKENALQQPPHRNPRHYKLLMRPHQ